MKRIALVFILILAVTLFYGQNSSNESKKADTFKLPDFSKIDQTPTFVIKVDSLSFKLDNFKYYNIESEWIESVDVLKDKISKKIYVNENGVVIIYTKDEYREEVIKEIGKLEDK